MIFNIVASLFLSVDPHLGEGSKDPLYAQGREHLGKSRSLSEVHALSWEEYHVGHSKVVNSNIKCLFLCIIILVEPAMSIYLPVDT